MKVIKVGEITYMRHWLKWYALPDRHSVHQLCNPFLMKFEGLRPFWEEIDELVPDFTNTKLKSQGEKNAKTKARA